MKHLLSFCGIKKIRFTRSDEVNDLEELNIVDLPKLKKSVFISCWTRTEEESIPLWNLYASSAKDVRIKLPFNMFNKKYKPLSYDGKCQIIDLPHLVTVKRSWYERGIFKLIGSGITYRENNAVFVLEKDKKLRINQIGTVKLEHWKFEENTDF